MTLKAHPIADDFRLMKPDEYEVLKQSIAESGLLEPVVLLDGMILDGRHRARACEELGIELQTVDFNGNDNPREFVEAKNDARRHLGKGARAIAAARRATRKRGRPKRVRGPLNEKTIPDIARENKVATKSVKRAKKVLDKGVPELVKAVESEEIEIRTAEQIAALPPKDQQEVVLTEDPKERRKKLKLAKDKALEKKAKPDRDDFELSGGRASDPSQRYYSVAEWEALSKPERVDIIAAGFESTNTKLNQQETTSIEWAQWSHNTVTGCLHNCPYCYARDFAERYFPQKFEPVFHPARLSAPGNGKIPPEAQKNESYRNIFANSMSDLFGSWVPSDWIESTIEMAKRNPDWNFLTLTKFPQRASEFEFPENWWMGTTVDAQARVTIAERAFEKIKCGTKWLSVEPLLEPLRFERLDLFNWIVIGGASFSSKTPAWVPPLDWIVNLHLQAREAKLKIYYKTNCGMQDELRIREFPWVKSKPKVLPKSFRYTHGLRQS